MTTRQTDDDRVLGSALDLQARFPSATVILLPADMSLQNKGGCRGATARRSSPPGRSGHPPCLSADDWMAADKRSWRKWMAGSALAPL